MGVSSKLENLSKIQERLKVKQALLLEQAMKSTNPSDIIKANAMLQNIVAREAGNKKSYVIDPYEFTSSFGYKDKPFSLSYTTLRRMAKAPIINAIIKTRKNQIADFAEPQADKYSTGFIIRKKQRLGEQSRKTTAAEFRRAEEIQKIVLNCGVNDSWENDDFETFIRKLVEDSLILDQMTFEVVRDRKGQVFEWLATDASTYRIADSYDDDSYVNQHKKQIKGYYPSYVQILNSNVEAEYYPWELCFGVRNPSSSIIANGYGCSELEDLVTVVTSMLWGDEYNRRFFSQGSAPKGLLRVKGTVNEKALEAFRQEWVSMIAGVNQSWKTPIVDGDIEWIDLQKNNRDMEYAKWQEYLIKLSCAIYSIDPNEVGFNVGGSEGKKAMFESNNEAKLQHSKDKGLYPILKFLQRKLNKYIISQIDPEYELLFVGLNGMSIGEQLDVDIKKVSNIATLNEIREDYGLNRLEDGDVVLNSVYAQQKLAKENRQAMMVQGGVPGQVDDENTDDNEEENVDNDEEENPYIKALKDELKKYK